MSKGAELFWRRHDFLKYRYETRHLDPLEDAALMQVFDLCFEQHDCTLPNDINWVVRKLGFRGSERIPMQVWREVVETVIDEFFEPTGKNDRIHSPDLSEEHQKASERLNKMVKNGRAGGLAKAAKHQSAAPAESTTVIEETSPASESKAPAPTNNKVVPITDQQFEAFYSIYPKQENEDAARAQFNRLIESGEATFEQIMAGARDYAAYVKESQRGSNPIPAQYISSPASFLSNGKYKDRRMPQEKRNAEGLSRVRC